ncbi:C6 zinc finger domain-containing protein [Colletotrichum truncatum]|uniref:C6 zinc finger domain-containing protein n=1 Tax=Colletotrichum truncatum TaxID=5467 RepID=A0ACC3YED8_COLTU|nr:C6 zinc finger domain-containing protein [Colletotrichum truncatum]KAF6790107.1 C6 zinc finger domain-containing protein [Colletotrichum truncatum]
MDERPSKKRKVRKGTRSCWQCRKRKIRCEFASNDDQTCAGCKIRGTTCVSQEFTDDEPSGPPERGLAQRLGRLEELMVKLADKMGPEISNAKVAITPASSVDGSLRTSDSLPSPDSRIRATDSADVMPSVIDLTPSQPTPESLQSLPKHERICRDLVSRFPSPRDAKTIVESSRGPVFVLILFYTYQDIVNGKPPPTAALAEIPDVSKHPAILAKHLLQLTICLQQLPPCFDASKLGFKKSIQDTMSEWVTAASQLTSNDELVGSAEGLECLVLLGFYLVNSGNLRKAWLAMRRALSLAQLIGIERNGSRPLKSCDPAANPATLPSSHQIWYRINFCDRYLSLLLGLPAGTQNNSFMADNLIANDTPMEKLEKRFAAISLRIIDRNHASPNEAYAMTQSIDCELETAINTMGRGWWEIPPLPDCTDITTHMSTMSHLMLQIHHHSLLILLHLPYMLRNTANNRYDYSKKTCLESSRAVLKRCVIFRTANNAAFSCRHIDYSSLIAAMTLLLGHISRPPGARDEEWAQQRGEDRALAQTVMAKMEELATLNDDKLSGESAQIIKQLLPIIDCCNSCMTQKPDEEWNVRLSIPYLGTININNSLNQDAKSHTLDLSHSELPTPSNTTTVSPESFPPSTETPPVAPVEFLLGQNLVPQEDISGGFSTDYLGWPCPGITAEAGDWTFQGVDTTYWSLLNSGMTSDFSQ